MTSLLEEKVARSICIACLENPDHRGDCQGNEWRWQDYLPAALAAIDSIMPDWAPIETAPKDGTCVLVCDMSFCYYLPQAAWFCKYMPKSEGDACWRSNSMCGDKINPTHWMPIPKMPNRGNRG